MGVVSTRRVWEKRGIFFYVLWLCALPLSFLYGIGVRIRNLLYSLGWLRVHSLPCAVVSVGNLTVGGTGKTPTTIWLTGELGRLGYRVVILSRGYKGTGKKSLFLEPPAERPATAVEERDALAAGDEPVMMARLFGLRVGVGKNRKEIGERILRENAADAFVLDDGFQHRQLSRDVDLLLLGPDCDGWVLPAGPFREPRSELRRANYYLVTGAKEEWQPLLAERPPETVFYGSLEARSLVTFEAGRWKEYPLTLLDRSKIFVVSAIADPTLFYRMIHDWDGEIIDTLQFPDHHRYSARDWQRINRVSRNADFILTTEKDIVKLARFPFARDKLMALRVAMTVENGDALVRGIASAIEARKARG
jgi:tetraacyldisaccharide 4'-kinase